MPTTEARPALLEWVPSPDDMAAMRSLQAYCPHTPTSKQMIFLAGDNLEAMYGGAAGGGKSDALLMAALQYVHVPGYAALLLRRTYPDLALPGAIMDRAGEWLHPTDATWHDKDKTWRFPSGATLTFGYLQTEVDKHRYQSAEFQFIGLDEATSFRESQYTYLLSRLRRLQGMAVPIRARCASNPGGPGHEWVHRRFVDKRTRGDRLFVPAKLEDNPYLDTAEYERSLAELDHITRRQLRHGDWAAKQESLFKLEWFGRRYKADGPLPEFVQVIQVVDSAFSADVAADWSVIATWGATANQIYLLDVWRKRVEYPQLIRALKDQYAKWEHASPWLYIENKASGQSAIQTIRQETAIPVRKFEPGTASKMARAQSGTLLFEAGRVVLPDAAPWLAAWIDEHLDYGAETAKSDAHDDQVDTSSMATKILGRMLSGIPATPEESPDA